MTDRLVLVVEDDPDHQLLVGHRLSPLGFVVECVNTLHDAVGLLSDRHRYDAVILDLGLPDVGEVDSIALLHNLTDVPVVVRTARSDDLTEAAALRAGAISVIHKGDEADEDLGATLEQAIELFRGRRRRADPQLDSSGGHLGSTDLQHIVGAVLSSLHAHHPMGAWAVARVAGNESVVIDAISTDYAIEPGQHFVFEGGAVQRSIEGQLPHLIPDLDDTPFAPDRNPLDPGVPVRAMVAAPLLSAPGTVIGLIVAFDPVPQELDDLQPVLAATGPLLASALLMDEEQIQLHRRLDVASSAARADALTGLGNRRAWELFLLQEEARCDRNGITAGLVIIDLDDLKHVNDTQGHDAGDRLIRKAGITIARATRDGDVAFRIGGDEFSVIGVGCDGDQINILADRMRSALHENGIAASVGAAARAQSSLDAASRLADLRMYEEKRSRKGDPSARYA